MRGTSGCSALGLWRIVAVVVVGLAACLLVGAATSVASATGGYPYQNKPTCASGNCTPDPWRFFYRECTSFVAWKLNAANGLRFHNDYDGNGTLDFGNAANWRNAAEKFGFKVDNTPKRGTVAWWSWGHVAWVKSVNSDGTVTLEEYNYYRDGNYNTRRVPVGNPTKYIHFKDLPGSSSSIADGDYIKLDGNATVYRVVGGAPLKVYSWSGVGGPKPFKVVSQSQFNTLAKYPRDGTLLRGATTGRVYIVAGGAPMYVHSWSGVGGSKPTVNVDQRAINNLPKYPRDGTVLRGATTGKVYIVAGGAPMHVSSWAAVGGSRPSTNVDQRAIDRNLLGYPRDGTFVRGFKSHRIYKVANQKTTYVPSISQVTSTPVNIDDWAITNQLRPVN